MRTELYLLCATVLLVAGTSEAREQAASVAGTRVNTADFYSERPGTNPAWQELIDQGMVIVGEKMGKPIQGTRITVNHERLEAAMGEVTGTLRPDRIHTHVNSKTNRKDFAQWSRWYQEDGNTQVFRLFKGEQSVRDTKNIKAGRIEAVKTVPVPEPGNWIEWEGTYTIIKPGHGCIFQILVEKDPETGKGGLWPLHLGQSPEGNLFMSRRRPVGDQEKRVLVAEDVLGKSVTMKVRFDGKTQYEVYRKVLGRDDDFVFVGAGTYHPNFGDKVGFRWGIYQGSQPGSSIREDCLLFVTGVQIRHVPADSIKTSEAAP